MEQEEKYSLEHSDVPESNEVGHVLKRHRIGLKGLAKFGTTERQNNSDNNTL